MTSAVAKLALDGEIIAKLNETERASEAAQRTADAIRKVAISGQIQQQDVPTMLIMALGWEEFSRQLLVKVH